MHPAGATRSRINCSRTILTTIIKYKYDDMYCVCVCLPSHDVMVIGAGRDARDANCSCCGCCQSPSAFGPVGCHPHQSHRACRHRRTHSHRGEDHPSLAEGFLFLQSTHFACRFSYMKRLIKHVMANISCHF